MCSIAAMVRQKEQVLGCGLALLDVNLGSNLPSGLDAYLATGESDEVTH